MTTFKTLLRYVYLFHDAPLCLLFPRCCAMATFSILQVMAQHRGKSGHCGASWQKEDVAAAAWKQQS